MKRDCKKKGLNFEDYIETPAGRQGEGKGSFAIFNYELKPIEKVEISQFIKDTFEIDKALDEIGTKKPRKKKEVDKNKYAVKGISRPDMRKFCKRHNLNIKDYIETKLEWYIRPNGLKDMKYNYRIDVLNDVNEHQ